MRQFILTKVEEIGRMVNDEVIESFLYYGPNSSKIPNLKRIVNDFRSCWKAINAGHDVRGMLLILSTRLDKIGNFQTKQQMKLNSKVDALINYVDNYDEFKGEELANIPWESIKLWS